MSDGFPLTDTQAPLWYAQRMEPDNPIYQCGHYLDIAGEISPEFFEAALTTVIDAADTMTVRLSAASDGAGRQTSLGVPAGLSYEYRDLRGEPDPMDTAIRFMRSDVAQTADLTSDRPLFHNALLRVGDSRFWWYQRFHHVVSDAFGIAMISRKVAQTYTALTSGDAAADIGFAGLAEVLADEQIYRESDRRATDREFWLSRFADQPEVPTLARSDAARPRDVHRVFGRMSAETTSRMSTLDASSGGSWPDLVVAVTAAYLHAMTGATDVVLGLPIMGRIGTPAARTPTTMVNVLPIRLMVEPDITLAELVRRVAAEIRAVKTHGRYRYEQLQRDLGLVGTGRPLFGPQVNIKPFDDRLRFGPHLATTHYLAAGPVDDLELVVYARSDGPEFGVDLIGHAGRYSRQEVAEHHERLAGLLEYAGNPRSLAEPLAALPICTPAERHRVLTEWSGQAVPVPAEPLPDLLVRQAMESPDAVAVRFELETRTYAELHADASRLARWLLAHGAGPGTVVAVALPRSIELMVAIVAIQLAGATYLPVDPDYPAERIAYVLSDAEPVAIIAAEGFEPDSAPAVKTRITLTAGQSIAEKFAEFAPTTPTDDDRPRPLRPDDPAYLIYTSGSTGRPKGVLVPHRGVVNRLCWMAAEYDIDGSDVILQKTPASFDVSIWEFFLPLLTGAELVLAEPGGHRDPAYLARLIRESGVTTVHFVPSMFRIFAAEPAVRRHGLGGLRRVICSGEELPADLVRDWCERTEVSVHNLYGPTEASVDVTAWDCPPDQPAPVPIGRPVWNTATYVLGPAGQPLPPGGVGELFLAGVQVANGYLNRPELTAERFRPDPCGPVGSRMYATGDLASWRPDGALEFRGRADRQVKIRGVRIELGEIEARLLADPQVAAAAVLAPEKPTGEPTLVAYVVPTPPADSVWAMDIRARLAMALPEQLMPSTFVSVESLPLTPNGKLDQAALADLTPAHESSDSGGVVHTPRQRLLAEMVADILGVSVVGAGDNFFDLGGNSLSAAALAARASELFGVEVGIQTVFAAPTVEALDRRLMSYGGSDDGSDDRAALDVLLPLRIGGDQPPLFCVHPAGGMSWCYAGLLAELDSDWPVYGLQSPGLAKDEPMPTSIDEMAGIYVDRIRAVAPNGPYRLLGWSVGGVIAQAMAARLSKAGATVESLVMLDAYPSDQWRDLAPPDETETLRALLFMAGLDLDALAGESVNRAAVMTALRSSGSALAGLPERTLAAIPDVVANNARLMREHRHEVADADLLFVTAAAPRSETWLSRDGWRPYLTGRIENHDIDVRHPALVRADSLRTIARLIAEHCSG